MRFCTRLSGSGANEPTVGQGYSLIPLLSTRDVDAAAGVGAPQKYHLPPDVFWMSTKLALLPELGATVALMSCARTPSAIPSRPARRQSRISRARFATELRPAARTSRAAQDGPSAARAVGIAGIN